MKILATTVTAIIGLAMKLFGFIPANLIIYKIVTVLILANVVTIIYNACRDYKKEDI